MSLKQYWSLLIQYLRPQRFWLALLAILILGNIGLRLANPQVMRSFIDMATQESGVDDASRTLARTATLFLGLAILQLIVSIGVTYVGRDVGWKTTNALRVDLTRHCLGLDMSFHNARTPGEMIERIDGDVNALSNFFSQFVVQIVGNAILLVGVLVLLFGTDWRAGTAIAVFSVVALLIIGRLQGFGASLWEAQRQASADLFGFLEERLAGTEDIRSCGAKAYVMRRFYELLRVAHKTFVKAGTIGAGTTHNTANVLFAIGNVTALAVGAYLFRQEAITVGTVYMILHYGTMLGWPIRQITRQMQDLQKAGASIARVRELLEIESRIGELGDWGIGKLGTGELAVEFRGVSFGYDDVEKQKGKRACGQTGEPMKGEAEGEEGKGGEDEVEEQTGEWVNGETNEPMKGKAEGEEGKGAKEMVLHDISFRLRAGAVMGLLGRTGSGKTTLSRLLFRLYDPDEGTIGLGHDTGDVSDSLIDIRTLSLAELRRRVGLVTQDIQLFEASMRDNLTFFDSSIPDQRISQAIQDLGLGSWLASLPEGLDTRLASGGGGLSAGEAQLLALTRIFLQDPGVVVLDEASSRLDPATEGLIERAVSKLISGRTAIIIAHRLGTVQRADEIMILEQGSICERGGREALARDPTSRFSRVLKTGLEEVLA